MKYRWVIITLSLFAASAGASSWETSGFRTPSGGLVTPGMSKADVRREAGAPLDSGRVKKSGKKSTKGNKKRNGEVWTYRGNDGYYALSFSGGTLSSIVVTPDRF